MGSLVHSPGSASLQPLQAGPDQHGAHRAQVRRFEFSNKSDRMAYVGHATSAQYTAALLHWAPRLKALMPDLLLGANGPMGCRSCSEHPEDKGICWWEQARV